MTILEAIGLTWVVFTSGLGTVVILFFAWRGVRELFVVKELVMPWWGTDDQRRS